VVSGMVTNYGWVISPNPRRADPPGGGTVRLVIDGTFLSAVPSGWTSRPDLTPLFPAAEYPGIVSAFAVAGFDSAALTNGVHTIAWAVTDNLGLSAGIGSRYFTVWNGNLTLDSGEPLARADGMAAFTTSTEASPAIRVRRGFDPDTAFQTVRSSDGRAIVQAEELDRIEVHLGDAGGTSYTGYLRVGTGLAPLPIGSTLDRSTGHFTWMPGVGFTGAYDLVFVQSAGGANALSRREVRIVLNPKRSNRVGPQTVIDVARIENDTSLIVAGWAADLDAVADSGVDTVHVWAYKVDGGPVSDPIWLGVAAYSGARPDVAGIYGDRFLRSGYGLRVQDLAPGTYDVAVFAYSTVLNGFTAAKTARVTVR
jgi:hypothetical protein